MVSINEINVRTRKDVQATDVIFSNNYACTLIIKPGMPIAEVLAQVDDFKTRIIELRDRDMKLSRDRELFSEFLNLSSRKANDKIIRLTDERMVEIVKLIPSNFHHSPPDLCVGDAVQLRGAPY